MINVTSLLLPLLACMWGVGNVTADAPQELTVQIVGDEDDQDVLVLHGTVCLSDDNGEIKRTLTGSPFSRHAIAIGGQGSPMILGGAVCLTIDEDEKAQKDVRKIVISAGSDEPKAIIGVRVTPMPAALAAHLGHEGLMIANVSEGSPADEAGVEQYDVVINFGGRAIVEMDDLLEAIRENGAGSTAKMIVIRGGSEKTLKITPVESDELSSWSFKFEEPEEAEADLRQKYFGHRFRVGPHGEALVMPHGRLDQIPDDIKDLLEKMPEFDLPPGDIDVWDLSDWPDTWVWQENLPLELRIAIGEEDSDAEITVDITRDGEAIKIHRSKDGTFTVEREDADGGHTSATYEDADELREQDPEAYRTYQGLKGSRMLKTWAIPPKLKDLGAQQHKFEIELKGQLEKAREKLEKAKEQAREAREQVELKIKKKMKEHDKAGVEAHTETVMIFVDDDGRVTVEIEQDGVSKKYEFESSEDFRKSEPELYERFKKHLKDA